MSLVDDMVDVSGFQNVSIYCCYVNKWQQELNIMLMCDRGKFEQGRSLTRLTRDES